MQKVSKAYKNSMKSSLRERGYIMVSFGLINHEAQRNAAISDGDFSYFSRTDDVFSERTDELVYASLEENFTRVDGSMLFLPRPNQSNAYINTGITSEKLVSEESFELDIDLNIKPIDFKGITIDFGENYPTDFDLVASTGQTIEYRGNTQGKFVGEDVLEHTNQVKLVVYAMKNPQSRVRIRSIMFGYGLVYYNKDVISSTLDSYVSPICADVPQIDFSVTIKNYDHYYNVDNPKSAINFLNTGQEMEIYYGYQLPDSNDIEWIKGNKLVCSEWESDDNTATIRCQDIFRNMGSEYNKGLYREYGISYYDLATLVLQEAGLEDYYLDPQLKHLFTTNPLPRVPHKEALQIIANACRCVLTQTRNGTIQIKSSFVPESSVVVNSEASYSNIANIMNTETKDEYGTLATNYISVDGNMFFIPRNINGNVLNTGFISSEISDENGYFIVNPKITITQEVACMWYGAKLVFGNSLPSEILIRTFNDSDLVAEYQVNQSDIERVTLVYEEFDDFDVMEIEFVKTQYPYNRIILNNFSFGDITEFTMTRKDMLTSPNAIKQELVKEIIVPVYRYQKGSEEESLINENVSVTSDEIMTFFIDEPSCGFRVSLKNVTDGAELVESGTYFVTIRFLVSGEYELEIFGYRYKIVEKYVTKTLGERGKTVKWENPLMSDMEMASDLADWLSDYYESGIEYEYDTRGNPELDVNDIIYQENEFVNGMKVRVYRQTLTFNQSFGGKITARRWEG